jgi:pyruvate/2-oxoglutarate/acetoin dehydrogenase E1 component
VQSALEAADTLAAEGIDAEVVDLRWIAPLDLDTLVASVEHTRNLVIVHEAGLTGGFGGEVATAVYERCFSTLAGPIRRVGAPDVPVPAAPSLQAAVIPDAGDIVGAVRLALG